MENLPPGIISVDDHGFVEPAHVWDGVPFPEQSATARRTGRRKRC